MASDVVFHYEEHVDHLFVVLCGKGNVGIIDPSFELGRNFDELHDMRDFRTVSSGHVVSFLIRANSEARGLLLLASWLWNIPIDP